MSNTARQRLFIASAVVAMVVFGIVAHANNWWGGYHWARTANPFTVPLGDNLTTTDWKSHLSQASSDWSKSSLLDTAIVAGSSTNKRCRPSSGTVQVCNGAYGYNGWLGLAQIWIDTNNHILQGAVKVNDSYFNLATYNNWAEKQHVICQEVGHTFGLDHQDTSGASLNTCMDYYHNTSDNDTKSTTPNAHDYYMLDSVIYVTTDSYSTLSTGAAAAAKMPPAMSELDFTSEENWGRLVSGSKAEGFSVYELDFGHGHKIETMVTWAK